MKRKTWFNLLVVLGCLLAMSGGARLGRRALAQEPAVEGVLVPQADTGTGFTYQGRLTNSSGNPIAGPCDFRFKLYTDGLSPTQVGSTVTRSNVTLTDGHFSAGLDFGSSAFDGAGRQLQVLVRCPAGSGTYTTLAPMVGLAAAPYAHSLRPGAQISSDTAGQLGSVLFVEDTYSGLFASAAFMGKSTQGDGVQGESGSGSGVQGKATGSSGTNYGVYGETSSPSGHGVYGTSPSTNPVYAGVTGVNTGGGVGAGVYGYSVGGYGVFGRSTTNKAIYADGDAHVQGDLTWQTMTSYVSVSAAAFRPIEEFYNYYNFGNEVWNEDGSSMWFYAPVQLPHGATITKVTFYWTDTSSNDGRIMLYAHNLPSDTADWIARVDTSGNSGDGSASDTSIISPSVVNNQNYSYYLEMLLYDENVKGRGVVIEYTFTKPY